MKRLFAPFVLIAALAGCSRDAGENKANTFEELSPKATLVEVDGVRYTKADAEEDLAIEISLLALQGGQIDKKTVERVYRRNRMSLLGRFVRRQTLLQEASRRGLTVSDGEYEAYRTSVIQRMQGRRIARAITKEDLEKAVGSQRAPRLAKRMREDALVGKTLSAISNECVTVITDADLADYHEKCSAYNRNALVTNAVIRKRAEMVYQTIQQGRKFEKAAQVAVSNIPHVRYDETPDEISESLLSDETNVLRRLRSMEPNAVMEPIEAFGGLAIIRLNEVSERTIAGTEKPEKIYNINYIFFELPEFLTELPDNSARDMLGDYRLKTKMKARVEQLSKDSKISYPHGRDIMRMGKSQMLPANPADRPLGR